MSRKSARTPCRGKGGLGHWALFGAACLLGSAVSGAALAGLGQGAGEDDDLVVVELFTSQGCSSCPPADRLLTELGKESDVLALSFHVDYWNRLGWKDPFSSREWSQRQERYSRQQASDSVYTPQMVIDGQYGFVGSDAKEARRLLKKSRATQKPLRVELQAERLEDVARLTVVVQARGESRREQRATDVLVLVTEESLVTPVRRGENGGRTLRNDYVVRELKRIPWNGEAVNIEVPLDSQWSGELRVAALIQERGSLRVLGAQQKAL